MKVDVVDLGAKHISFKEEFHFLVVEALENLGDGEASISNLQVCGGIVVHKDKKIVALERFRVRDVTLKKLRAKFQIPPPGPVDRTDISWEEKINQGQGRSKNTCTTIIPCDKLQDYCC